MRFGDDDGVSNDEPTDAPQVVTEKLRNNSDVVVIGSSDAKSNEPPDIVSISDLDSLFSELSDAKGESGTAPSAHVGRVIVIEDVAYAVPFVHLINVAKMAQVAPYFHRSSGDSRRCRLLPKCLSNVVPKMRRSSQTSEDRPKFQTTFDGCKEPPTFGHKPSRVDG